MAGIGQRRSAYGPLDVAAVQPRSRREIHRRCIRRLEDGDIRSLRRANNHVQSRPAATPGGRISILSLFEVRQHGANRGSLKQIPVQTCTKELRRSRPSVLPLRRSPAF